MGSIANRFRVREMTGKLPKRGSPTAYRAAMTNATRDCAQRALDAEREALKGTYLGNCNVTACQQPGAVWWNKAMGKWYCRSCAHAINAPGWPLGDKTPIICFDRGIYVNNYRDVLP